MRPEQGNCAEQLFSAESQSSIFCQGNKSCEWCPVVRCCCDVTRNLNLRFEFEKLANRYGLTLPAKLKKGNLVLEWKPLPGELHNRKAKTTELLDLKSVLKKLSEEFNTEKL